MPHFVRGDCTNSLLLPGSIISTTEQLLETLGCFSSFSFSFFFFKQQAKFLKAAGRVFRDNFVHK